MKKFIFYALVLVMLSSTSLICGAYDPPKPVASNQTVCGSESVSEDEDISDSSDDSSEDSGSVTQAIGEAVNAATWVAINAAIKGLF